jgi:hypothetical protein
MSREAIQQLSEEVTAKLWSWENNLRSELHIDVEGPRILQLPQTLLLQ